MECLQLRSPPGPAFHYLISEQAKSLVALQELQNEVGALLEFRDLVIETFPNLRSKMAPSTPASDTRRDWEPGVRVRRKLAAGGGDARAKPQPSVQDSGFSTETSCKEAHSASAPPAPRPRPLEDELWALLDVIQRKGVRLRDEAELLRGELDDRHSETAEESFARALCAGGDCADLARMRSERDALLAQAARLEAQVQAAPASPAPPRSPPARAAPRTPLGRLDRALAAPDRTPRVNTPDSRKFAAILQESNPVELRRQLLFATVQNQALSAAARGAAARLQRARDHTDDLKFRLEEKSIELEGALARLRQLENQRAGGDERGGGRPEERADDWGGDRGAARGLDWSEERSADRGPRRASERGREWSAERGSMRDLRPLALPGDPAPRARPSRIPRHKGAAPRPPAPGATAPSRPPSAQSVRSARSAASGRGRPSPSAGGPGAPSAGGPHKEKCSVPVRRSPSHDSKWAESACASLVAEYVARTERLAAMAPRLASLAPLAPRLASRSPRLCPPAPPPPRTRPLPANLELEYRPSPPPPQNLALELTKSILYEVADSIDKIKSLDEDSLWNGKPQQYFESMNYGRVEDGKDFEDDSLA